MLSKYAMETADCRVHIQLQAYNHNKNLTFMKENKIRELGYTCWSNSDYGGIIVKMAENTDDCDNLLLWLGRTWWA